MTEEQAICRIYRMGQTKDVTIVRFLMKNSFEEVRILDGVIQCSSFVAESQAESGPDPGS